MVDQLDDEWWKNQKYDDEDVALNAENKNDISNDDNELKKSSKNKRKKDAKQDDANIPSSKKIKRDTGGDCENVESEKRSKINKKKTKSEDDVKAGSVESVGNVVKETSEKKKKRKKNSISEALARQKPLPLVPYDLTSAMDKYFKGKLTAVELDEVALTEEHFAMCNDLTHTATSYLKSLDPHWKKHVKHLNEKPGAPLFLVVSSSGQRAADFVRAISEMKVEGFSMAKLFAKHLKLDCQRKFLQSKKIHIGVGTPNRLHQLLDNGSLSLEQVKFVVLDWSWRDAKLRRLVDTKEVCADVMGLLRKHVLPLVHSGKTKIGLL